MPPEELVEGERDDGTPGESGTSADLGRALDEDSR
jgi:hypothetical protein